MASDAKTLESASKPLMSHLNTCNWMRDLPDHVKKAPLCSLSIPGSHESFTYSLQRSGTAGPDQPECIRRLTRRFPRISSRILYNWSVTQGKTATDQLERGIRYFDIRLEAVGEKEERDFQIIHCLLGARVIELLEEIKKFLLENKTEIVMLDFQHFYQFDEMDHDQLIKFLMSHFQNMLCAWYQEEINKISLASLQARGVQVFLIYPSVYLSQYTNLRTNIVDQTSLTYLWPRSFFPNPWPETTNTSVLKPFLERKLAEKDGDKFFISQGILTPDWRTIVSHPFSNLNNSCGESSNKTVEQWLKETQQKPNIVITDFIGMTPCSCDIISTIIGKNYDG